MNSLLYIYAPNEVLSKYLKLLIGLKNDNGTKAIVDEHFNTILSPLYRATRLKLNRKQWF